MSRDEVFGPIVIGVGHLPAVNFRKMLRGRPYLWFLNHVMTVKTPLGSLMKANVLTHSNLLVRMQREQIASAWVDLTPSLADALDGRPQLEDKRTLPVEGVVWETGFLPDDQWIDLPVFDETGQPRHVEV